VDSPVGIKVKQILDFAIARLSVGLNLCEMSRQSQIKKNTSMPHARHAVACLIRACKHGSHLFRREPETRAMFSHFLPMNLFTIRNAGGTPQFTAYRFPLTTVWLKKILGTLLLAQKYLLSREKASELWRTKSMINPLQFQQKICQLLTDKSGRIPLFRVASGLTTYIRIVPPI